MPVILLERLPLPSLRTYTVLSLLMLTGALFYAHSVILELEEERERNTTDLLKIYNDSVTNGDEAVTIPEKNITEADLAFRELSYSLKLLTILLEDPRCIWAMVNMAYCCLILVGKLIQKLVFGELRVSEQQHLKDKFWNFVFYKFIFIFGVMNVQRMEEVVGWCAWFSVLGFLHLLAQLCKDRFEYLSFSATTPTSIHVKVFSLLFGIQAMCGSLVLTCSFLGYYYMGANIFAFMAAEVLLLGIKTLYVIVRYGIHLYDLNREGVWENRTTYSYYTEIGFELVALSVDFLHHLHMLVWGNIFLSMASLVICMQLRYLFHEFQRRIRRHKNFQRVVSSMEARFPMATMQEIENNNDECAICWEKMDSARKLPCGHLFHNSCLRSWLEQDVSCPTCRTSLSDLEIGREAQPTPPAGQGDAPAIPLQAPPHNQTTNHFFHFDGSRYVSWLPSFSVEVTHTQLMGNNVQASPTPNSQMDNMVRQVHEVFPHMPDGVILDDLRITHSVELTIDNIVEGRVTAPPILTSRGSSQQLHDSATDSDSSDSSVHPIEHFIEHGLPFIGDVPPFVSQALPFVNLSTPSISQPSQTLGVAQTLSTSTELHRENLEQYDAASSQISSEHTTSVLDSTSTNAHAGEQIEDFPSMFGGRFSKSPSERESMLLKRKDNLLQQAKRRFMAKQQDPISIDTSEDDSILDGSSSDVDLLRRREILLRAAQRRMQNSD